MMVSSASSSGEPLWKLTLCACASCWSDCRAVIVLGVVDAGGRVPLRVHVDVRGGRRSCTGCGKPAR